MKPDVTPHPSSEAAPADAQRDTALLDTLGRLFVPLAKLCLANGITFAAAEDVLKRAFVQEAAALQPDAPEHGTVSRVSTATGISRREVTRLIKAAPGRHPKQPLAAEVFARWTTDPALRGNDGAPLPLDRQGPAPSFEALAQSVTRDVHPRSMLDELVRLGLVGHDEETDRVTLTRRDFVPDRDSQQMLGFLGDNVGDHLDGAVANIVQGGDMHHEQAVFADELSAESVEALRPLIVAQWQALRDALVPTLTDLIEADHSAGRHQDRRVRIGLYSFADTMQDCGAVAGPPDVTHQRKSPAKDGHS